MSSSTSARPRVSTLPVDTPHTTGLPRPLHSKGRFAPPWDAKGPPSFREILAFFTDPARPHVDATKPHVYTHPSHWSATQRSSSSTTYAPQTTIADRVATVTVSTTIASSTATSADPITHRSVHTLPLLDDGSIDLERALPIEPLDRNAFLSPTADVQFVWLGHATTLTQLHGFTVLTDPFFSQRASAWQRVGPQRLRPPACTIADLPPVDAIVISHDHYDHLDYNSVYELYHSKLVPQERDTGRSFCFYVPLGMGAWLKRHVGVADEHVVEMSWWQTSEHTFLHASGGSTASSSSPSSPSSSAPTKARIHFVPAHHWSGRGLLDRAVQLWGGYVVEHGGRKLYFAGDTAYCDVFKDIGRVHGPIDVAAIPIGAYSPQWFMRHVHIDPVEAVQVHVDVGARQSYGIHWGTIMLTAEPFIEPAHLLEHTVRERGLDARSFTTTTLGRVVVPHEADVAK